MSFDLDTLNELEPTTNDFRRVGRGVPLVMLDGKRVRYRRSSSVGKVLDDESGLTDWRIRTTVEGAAQRPDLMALVSTYDHDANKKEIRDIAEMCLVQGKGTQRRETGTAVHAMLDHLDADDGWQPAPQFADACRAYIIARDAYGLIPVDIECKCVNDMWRLAGTMDRRYRTTRVLIAPDGSIIPIGSIIAADTKTGQSLEYAAGTYATQLAAYVDSVRYDPATDEREPFDPPTFDAWALVVHLEWEQGICEMHWVDLEAGRHGIKLANDIYEWRRRSGLLTPARVPLHIAPGDSVAPAYPEPPITTSNDVLEANPSGDAPTVTGNEAAPVPPAGAASPELLDDVREWLRERCKVIANHSPQAVDMLQRTWPVDVPGLKQPGHTEGALDAIAHAITNVERQYELPFAPRDPRAVASDVWARPADVQSTNDERDALARSVANHPRKALLEKWSVMGKASLDPAITDRTALTHALYEFALAEPDWSDEDVSEMLHGTLRAIGYEDGLDALGHVVPEHAPLIMSAAFAMAAGTAMLLFDVDGKPVVRIITK